MGKESMPYHNDTTHEQHTNHEFGRVRKTGRSCFERFAICKEEVWVEKHAQLGACQKECRYRTP